MISLNINVNDWKESALFVAAQGEAVEMVRYLLSCGADVSILYSAASRRLEPAPGTEKMSDRIRTLLERRQQYFDQTHNDQNYPSTSIRTYWR